MLRFSISSSVSLVICVFPGICQFHLGYLICWHESCLSYFSKGSNNVTTFIPDVSDLHPLIFLCQFSCRFVNCFLVFRKAVFSFIDSLVSIFFTIFFLSVTLDLVCFFPNSSRYILKSSIWDLSYFLMYGLNLQLYQAKKSFTGDSVVMNLPSIQETRTWSLGKDPLEKEMETNPVFLHGKSHGQRLGEYSPWGCKQSDTTCMLAYIYTSHKKPWGNVISILLSEKSPSQKATYCTIPVIWHHSTKGKTSRSIQFSHSVVSNSLQPHGLQHTRPPYPSPTPRTYSKSCSSSQWYHPTISSSHPVLLLPSNFPSIRVFSSDSVLCIRWQKCWSFSCSMSPSVNIHDWFPLGWTGWISLQSKGLSSIFFNTTLQKHQFFSAQLFYSPTLTSIHDYWKNHSFD